LQQYRNVGLRIDHRIQHPLTLCYGEEN